MRLGCFGFMGRMGKLRLGTMRIVKLFSHPSHKAKTIQSHLLLIHTPVPIIVLKIRCWHVAKDIPSPGYAGQPRRGWSTNSRARG